MKYNKQLFEGVPKKNANMSRFNLSHEYKANIFPGFLVPVINEPCYPQDEWSIHTEFFFRFSPLWYPLMHQLNMRCRYFWVPNRILWNEESGNTGWKKWITENEDVTPPQFTATIPYLDNSPNDQLLAYMGLPLIDTTTAGSSPQILGLNAFSVSAILKIFDEWYRNPQIQAERWFNLQEGDNTTAFSASYETVSGVWQCLKSNWELDYFTSCLPQPQQGDPLLIPSIGMEADGTYITPQLMRPDGTDVPTGEALQSLAGSKLGSNTGEVVIEQTATIKQLRIAEALQSLYERAMKVGARYRDNIRGFWGIDPQPGDVSVPVLIGSFSGRVQISDVMTQSFTTIDTTDHKTGDYSGQANLYSNENDMLHYKCREHGWLIALLEVNANTSYGQGIARHWRYDVQTDYPIDMLMHIGDQEVLKEEVLYNPKTAFAAKNRETFGYIPRGSEVRYKNNIHVGVTNYTGRLSQHAGRYWGAAAFEEAAYDSLEINERFVQVNPDAADTTSDGGLRASTLFRAMPTSGGVALEEPIQIHLFHTLKVNRAFPMYSTPKLT